MCILCILRMFFMLFWGCFFIFWNFQKWFWELSLFFGGYPNTQTAISQAKTHSQNVCENSTPRTWPNSPLDQKHDLAMTILESLLPVSKALKASFIWLQRGCLMDVQKKPYSARTWSSKICPLLVFTLSTSRENQTFTNINRSFFSFGSIIVSHILELQECTFSAVYKLILSEKALKNKHPGTYFMWVLVCKHIKINWIKSTLKLSASWGSARRRTAASTMINVRHITFQRQIGRWVSFCIGVICYSSCSGVYISIPHCFFICWNLWFCVRRPKITTK